MTTLATIGEMETVPMDDGVRLRTWTSGVSSSRPPVILLHGGPGMWDYLGPVARLVDDLTVVHRFDQRGCGGSQASKKQTVDRLLADVECLRHQWGHRRVTVVGHSFGATLALLYAAAYPDAVAGVGYLSGVGLGDWHRSYAEERLRRMSAGQQARLTTLSARSDRGAEEETEYRALAWSTDHADPERAWGWALADAATPYAINVEANRVLCAETNAWDDEWLASRAHGITVPVMLVHGAGDPRPAWSVEQLAAAVPRARFEVLDGAGHHPWRERPDELRTLLTELVTTVSTMSQR